LAVHVEDTFECDLATKENAGPSAPDVNTYARDNLNVQVECLSKARSRRKKDTRLRCSAMIMPWNSLSAALALQGIRELVRIIRLHIVDNSHAFRECGVANEETTAEPQC
jgi:hypothetical protein